MNDGNKVYNRLIVLSDKIVSEFDLLSNLSYMNQENTRQFHDHVLELRDLLEKERIILFNLNDSEFTNLCEFLIKHEDISFAYVRTLNMVTDFLVSRGSDSHNNSCDEGDIEDVNFYDESDRDISEIIDSYYTDSDDTLENATYVNNCFATRAIKTMYDRILNTYTDNSNDEHYKKRMLKYFNRFKYYYFMLNNQLEMMGVNYSFDLNKIVIPTCIAKDIGDICYNECITIIASLYEHSNGDFHLQTVERSLFNMMMFDEYIKNIGFDDIDKLIALCDEISLKNDTFYGNIARQKLIKKRQKD